ncbi:unnamed protein product, partial [Ectocarpus sp. 12 AP-2014]
SVKKKKELKPELLVIGWIEHIDLPELGLRDIRTKIDTGARTSALHATQIEQFTRSGKQWVRFHVDLVESEPGFDVETQVYDLRSIKNTSGVPEERVVIRTAFGLAGRMWPISVSLTDRADMTFPMIVGRSALKRQNIAVHTRKADILSPAKEKARKSKAPDN